MSDIDTAQRFFDACERGQGWEACKEWCAPDASFACQADALADITTLEAYCGWMAGLLTPIPDGRYELTGFAYDAQRQTAIASAVFHGTASAEGGPVPPTGRQAASDYVYVIAFKQGRVQHMTKIWNDLHALRQLGWA